MTDLNFSKWTTDDVTKINSLITLFSSVCKQTQSKVLQNAVLSVDHRCQSGMPNKATAFTIISAIGLCNLVAFLLFTNPARQITFSYLPLGEISNDTSRHCNNASINNNTNTLNNPSFVERTLMATGEKKLQTEKTLTPHPRTGKVIKHLVANKNKVTTTSRPLTTVEPPPTPRVDPHEYNYVVNQPHLCAGVEPPTLVIFVCTSLINFDARRAVRDTWGSMARNAPSSDIVRLAFLLGTSLDPSLNERIKVEAANYSDVIQEDFVDTYNNLTLKSIMMLKWVNAHCPRAHFLLKTDDDMFIHVTNLLKYLNVVKKRKRLLFGRLMRGARPFRQKTSKWYAPVSTYRERVYPDYLSGTAYAMSMDVARSLLNVTLRTPLFHLEDVFITGICARRVGIPRRHYSGFTYERRAPTGCAFRNAISGHKVSPTDMKIIWEELKTIKKNSCH
uniref:Hexosyltransferase n=1 Tax=Strigamia maritima TaxID=126957 RepID=T1J4G6_STRMM